VAANDRTRCTADVGEATTKGSRGSMAPSNDRSLSDLAVQLLLVRERTWAQVEKLTYSLPYA
jgi:hypothetical protein